MRASLAFKCLCLIALQSTGKEIYLVPNCEQDLIFLPLCRLSAII